MLRNNFTMDTQIKSLCKSIDFHLRNIATIMGYVTLSATEQLIHSLVTWRLDYCNSLLYGSPKYKMNYLQRVQNIAARVVMRCPRRDHITPNLKSRH